MIFQTCKKSAPILFANLLVRLSISNKPFYRGHPISFADKDLGDRQHVSYEIYISRMLAYTQTYMNFIDRIVSSAF